MVGKLISAVFLPCILVMLFSRVTYNRFVGLGLTVALIAASAYKGYTHAWWLVIVDAMSLTAGFYFSTKMMNRPAKSS